MHNKTHTTARHRWTIGIPVFLACLAVSMADVLVPGSVLTQPETTVIEGSAVQSGSLMQMQQGTATIGTHSLVAVNAGDAVLFGWNGVFDVTSDTNKLTVAALSTPVLVKRGDHEWMIPVSMQGVLKNDDVSMYPLPSHYLEERLPKARQMMKAFEMTVTDNRIPSLLAEASHEGELLLLFHPATRADAWVLPHESTLTAWLTLIPSDRLDSAMPELAINQWAVEVAAAMSESEDMNVFASAYFSAFHDTIDTLRADGYPHRAQQYAKALVETLHKDIRSLNEDARASFAAIETLAHGDVPMAEEVVLPVVETGSTVAETVDVVSINMDEAVASLRANLAAHSAMFTAKTTITPDAAQRIQVDGIVMATAKGDQILRFTFNPVSNEVENIEHDGKILPYSLSLEKYVEWVKGK